MTERTLILGDELFSFSSEQDWINNAQSRYANCGVPKGYYITVDAAGRVCKIGKHFMRATAEETYPVTVYKMRYCHLTV